MAIETLTIKTKDGLNLDLARYPGGGAGLPAFCIPGLTRNRRDFDDFAKWLSARGRDVYAISLRGRGRSDYDPKYLNYFPTIYREDVLGALDTLGIQRAVFVGTSLGGIVTMLLTFCGFVIWFAVPYFWSSFQLNETSASPGGLPYRWFLKSFIVTAFVLLALAGLSRLSRVWAALFGRH